MPKVQDAESQRQYRISLHHALHPCLSFSLFLPNVIAPAMKHELCAMRPDEMVDREMEEGARKGAACIVDFHHEGGKTPHPGQSWTLDSGW